MGTRLLDPDDVELPKFKPATSVVKPKEQKRQTPTVSVEQVNKLLQQEAEKIRKEYQQELEFLRKQHDKERKQTEKAAAVKLQQELQRSQAEQVKERNQRVYHKAVQGKKKKKKQDIIDEPEEQPEEEEVVEETEAIIEDEQEQVQANDQPPRAMENAGDTEMIDTPEVQEFGQHSDEESEEEVPLELSVPNKCMIYHYTVLTR